MEIILQVSDEQRRSLERKAFNSRMTLKDFILDAADKAQTVSIRPGAGKVEPIDGCLFLHRVDGSVAFKATGASAVEAAVRMESQGETPEETAAYLHVPVAAVLEAAWFKSRHPDEVARHYEMAEHHQVQP